MKNKSQITFELKQNAYKKLSKVLNKFGDSEIGGILIGAQLGINHFIILDVTIADDIGRFSITKFIREPMKSIKILMKSFHRRNYNYLGEWHSHPNFDLYPSNGDISTVNNILLDPDYAVGFVLLIIAKLENQQVKLGGFLFHKDLSEFIQAKITMN